MEDCGQSYLCIMDSDMRVLYATSSFSGALGYALNEISGARVLVDDVVVEILSKRGSYKGTAVFRNSSGEGVYARCEIEPCDNNYAISNFEIIRVMDVESRVDVYLKDPKPIFVISPHHVILDANEKMATMARMKRSEMVGKKCYVIMHGTSEPPPGCPLVDALSSGKEVETNLMETVFGSFLIYVQHIGDGVFAHYALREAAVLFETRGRIIELQKRYNRIPKTTAAVGNLVLKSDPIDTIIKEMTRRLMEVNLFKGVGIFYTLGSGKSGEAVSGVIEYRDDESPVEIHGDRYLVFPFEYGDVRGKMVINLGDYEISEDEKSVLKILAKDLSLYLHHADVDNRREIAYRFVLQSLEDFAHLVDRIRNPLAVIMATAELEIEDEEVRRKIMESVEKIEMIAKKIDETWNRMERMRDILRR